jgi:dinuclear metal center YbgI/SA1388 family protein
VIGVCHEVTEQVVERALADCVDLMVTYHPLLFRPTNRLLAGRSPAGRAFRLIAGGVALAVAHTSFDMMEGGTADALAHAVGLTGTRRFGPVDGAPQVKVVTFAPADAVESITSAMSAAGAGVIGNYSGCSFRVDGMGAFDADPGANPVTGSAESSNREPEIRVEMIAPAVRRDTVCAALTDAHPYEEPAYDVYDVQSNLGFIGRVGPLPAALTLETLASSVSSALGAVGVRVSGDPGAEVATVAVIPGSGGSFVSAAHAAGAQVLVTGDVGHHTVVQAIDAGLAVIDVGHTTSERPGMRALFEVVSRVGSESDASVRDMTDLDPTPWR